MSAHILSAFRVTKHDFPDNRLQMTNLFSIFPGSRCSLAEAGKRWQPIVAGVFLGLAAMTCTDAIAQQPSPQCVQYRMQLTSLLQRGPGAASASAAQQRIELSQLTNYYRSRGCQRGLFSVFSGSPPAECAGIAQRMNRLEASIAQASGSASAFEARRQELQAAIARACSSRQPDNRGFFDRLFSPRQPSYEPPPQSSGGWGDDYQEGGDDSRPTYGGKRTICVRSCDGFFFPLGNIPGGRANGDEMCKALCPNAEVSAYTMSGGDKAIEYAIAINGGQRYIQTPNALRYRQEFVPNCSCKALDQTWAEVSGRAEEMLKQQKGDIIVTEERSREMAKPKETAEQKKKRAAEEARIEAESRAQATSGEAAPTAGTESSGIGPRAIEETQVVDEAEGPREVVTDEHGTKRTIRIIAPKVIPPPPNTTR